MKILQINNYNYLKGGSEKVYQVTIELLKANGHQVKYFSIADPRNEELCEGYAVSIQKWSDVKGLGGKLKGVRNFIYNRQVAWQLDSFWQEYHPDVAHLHIFYGNLSNAIVDVLRKHHIPMVQSVHEFRLLCPVYTCLDPHLEICEKCAKETLKLSCVLKRCVKNSLLMSTIAAMECFVRDVFYSYQKNISAFIMVSRFIENKHIDYFPQIASKCHQIYNSIDVDYYEKFVIPTHCKERYYLYLGRLSYEKGIKTLINVFKIKPHLHLKIAGTGVAENELKKYTRELGLSNVEFLGFVSGEKLLNIVSAAYFTMVPSEWYENNPLSVIESLALGTPVIGSDIGGIPELIVGGKNGFLHKPKDEQSLSEALQCAEGLSREEYESFCTFSVDMAREFFDNRVYYQKLIKLYEQITQKG